MTLQDLLYIQLHGEKNLQEEETKKEISSYINEEYDFFVGSQRAENILNNLNEDLPYIPGLKKAVEFLKVNEKRILKEEPLTKNGAKILLHDIMNGLLESSYALEKSIHIYNRANKKDLAKIYSTVLFESHLMAKKFGIELDDISFKNEEMDSLINEDLEMIIKEVL